MATTLVQDEDGTYIEVIQQESESVPVPIVEQVAAEEEQPTAKIRPATVVAVKREPIEKRIRKISIDYNDKLEGTDLIRGRYKQIASLIDAKPRRMGELEAIIGVTDQAIRPYLYYMLKRGAIEVVPSENRSIYYRITERRLEFINQQRIKNGLNPLARPDYSGIIDVGRVPEYVYWELPVIQNWRLYHDKDDLWQRSLVINFQSICWGKAASTFKAHPDLWTRDSWVELARKFVNAYQLDHPNKKIPARWLHSIKSFVKDCLQIQPTPDQLRRAGLIVSALKGKHNLLKLTKEEIDKAIAWMETEGIKLAPMYGLEPERLLAHFGLSMESCARPSRTLTIETERIEKIMYNKDDPSAGYWIRCRRYETKTASSNAFFLSYVLNPKLSKWVGDWQSKRAILGYKYLLLDDSNYQPHEYDDEELRPIRDSYIPIYKQLFSHLGKDPDKESDRPFFNRTLYVWRHVAVKLWISRNGQKLFGSSEPAKITLADIMRMGWEDMDTLADWYGGLDEQDLESNMGLNEMKNY